jgi:hypothetical protein
MPLSSKFGVLSLSTLVGLCIGIGLSLVLATASDTPGTGIGMLSVIFACVFVGVVVGLALAAFRGLTKK